MPPKFPFRKVVNAGKATAGKLARFGKAVKPVLEMSDALPPSMQSVEQELDKDDKAAQEFVRHLRSGGPVPFARDWKNDKAQHEALEEGQLGINKYYITKSRVDWRRRRLLQENPHKWPFYRWKKEYDESHGKTRRPPPPLPDSGRSANAGMGIIGPGAYSNHLPQGSQAQQNNVALGAGQGTAGAYPNYRPTDPYAQQNQVTTDAPQQYQAQPINRQSYPPAQNNMVSGTPQRHTFQPTNGQGYALMQNYAAPGTDQNYAAQRMNGQGYAQQHYNAPNAQQSYQGQMVNGQGYVQQNYDALNPPRNYQGQSISGQGYAPVQKMTR